MASSTPCPYCGEPLDARLTHAEHPLARALAGALVIEAHLDCGDRLNREVDEPLLHCMPVVVVDIDSSFGDDHDRAVGALEELVRHAAQDRPEPPATAGADDDLCRAAALRDAQQRVRRIALDQLRFDDGGIARSGPKFLPRKKRA